MKTRKNILQAIIFVCLVIVFGIAVRTWSLERPSAMGDPLTAESLGEVSRPVQAIGSLPGEGTADVWPVLCTVAGHLDSLETSSGLGGKQDGAQDPAVENTFDLPLHLKSFDQAIETIVQSHWDQTLIEGVFKAKVAELRPQVEAAKSPAEVRELLESALASLGQSHYGVIPSGAYANMEERERRGGAGYSGMTLRFAGGEILVTAVRGESPAAVAGIQMGWKFLGVESMDVEAIVKQAQELVDTSTMRLETAVSLVANQVASGPEGGVLDLKFENNEGSVVEVEVVLGKPVGNPAKFGNLPVVPVEFRADRLPEDVGYVTFNAFLDAPRVMRQFNEAIETYRDAKGLVIDLRGNMGGLMVLTMGMCGWFVDEPVELGTMTMRGATMNLRLNPRQPKFDKPVAVLIDAVSISAAEVMAGGMQDAGTARVFGERSAGLVLPSNVTRLANGDGLQYAMSDYHSLSGRSLENDGVVPDVEVVVDQAALRRGVDPVLEAAVQWIVQQGQE